MVLYPEYRYVSREQRGHLPGLLGSLLSRDSVSGATLGLPTLQASRASPGMTNSDTPVIIAIESSHPPFRSHDHDAPTVSLPLMSTSIKYRDLHSLPAYNTSSTSRLKSLYSDVSRQKHSNPAAYRSTVHWWREVLQAVVLKHWLPQSSDTLVLHALPTLVDSFRYEGAGKPLCLATVIVSSVERTIFGPER